MDIHALREVVTIYREHVSELGLDARTRQKADAAIATMEAQLIDDPDPTIIKAAGKSLRTIVEGAIGGAIGNAASSPEVWARLLALLG